MNENNTLHLHHLPDLPRLNRLGGQVSGVKKMIEEGRDCPEILTQLRAIRAAIKGLEASILERHLGHCLTESIESGNGKDIQKKVEELKSLFKKYDD